MAPAALWVKAVQKIVKCACFGYENKIIIHEIKLDMILLTEENKGAEGNEMA